MSRKKQKSKKRRTSGDAEAGADSGEELGAPAPTGFRRWWRLGAAVAIVVAAPLVAVTLWIVLPDSDEPEGPKTAAIIDQLSLTFPNPDFAEEATATLERAGYLVDYFPGEEVTVNFFRTLPEQDYDVLVVRAHSARIQGEFDGRVLDETVIFTNELYNDQDYLAEQRVARLDIAYTYPGAPEYFGVTADFIEFSMQGNLDDTMVIMMGCEGLASERTAEAFINKGADNYVSWSDTVSASHTDAATARFLEHQFIDGLSSDDAVARTMEELGPDPTYDSVLLNFDSES